MTKRGRIDNMVMREAGLSLMRENGKPLTKSPSRGRSMLYSMPNGESVRVRTCNRPMLLASVKDTTADASMNIEGTDWLLIVIPEARCAEHKVVAYLVPTREAVESAHKSHQAWLSSNPNTKGNNTTRHLWFGSYSGKAGREEKYGYAEKWAKYRLSGDISTGDIAEKINARSSDTGSIQVEVETARKRIAQAASVRLDAVKISIDFSV